MIKHWLKSFMRAAPGREALQAFSLARLGRENPGLARHYLWDRNPMPAERGALWLHFGCGERVLDGFVNLDFIPHDERVTAWNLLDLWPEKLADRVEGVFFRRHARTFFPCRADFHPVHPQPRAQERRRGADAHAKPCQ